MALGSTCRIWSVVVTARLPKRNVPWFELPVISPAHIQPVLWWLVSESWLCLFADLSLERKNRSLSLWDDMDNVHVCSTVFAHCVLLPNTDNFHFRGFQQNMPFLFVSSCLSPSAADLLFGCIAVPGRCYPLSVLLHPSHSRLLSSDTCCLKEAGMGTGSDPKTESLETRWAPNHSSRAVLQQELGGTLYQQPAPINRCYFIVADKTYLTLPSFCFSYCKLSHCYESVSCLMSSFLATSLLSAQINWCSSRRS